MSEQIDYSTVIHGATDDEPESHAELREYIGYLVNYFYEPYNCGEDVSDINMMHLMFLYCFHNKDKLDFVEYDEFYMYIKYEKLKYFSKSLFGLQFDLDYYTDTLETISARYNPATDIYTVGYATDYWGGEFFFVDFEAGIDIVETNGGIKVVCQVYQTPDQFSDEKSNFKTLEYFFSRSEFDGVKCYTLEYIR